MRLRHKHLLLPPPAPRPRPWLIPLAGLVGIVGWAATATSQTDRPPAGRPSTEHFTLAANLPAQTVLHAYARYTPKPAQIGCPYQNPVLPFDTPAASSGQDVEFKVALGYELPDCSLYLNDLSFETEALHGEGGRQRSMANNGALAIRDDLRQGRSGFALSGEKAYRSLCDLQSGGVHPGDGQRLKLVCNATDEHWQLFGKEQQRSQLGGVMSRQELEGKRIRLEIRRKDLD